MNKTESMLRFIELNEWCSGAEIRDGTGYKNAIRRLHNLVWQFDLSRKKINGVWRYSIQKPEIVKTVTGNNVFFESRGFEGVDIDAVHFRK